MDPFSGAPSHPSGPGPEPIPGDRAVRFNARRDPLGRGRGSELGLGLGLGLGRLRRPLAWRQPLTSALGLALVMAGLTACVPAQQRPSWRIYPLQRSQPHDGLAVVNQPDGYGLHLWLETDTSESGVCRPRWVIDGARLFNGNGSAPFSSGLATRQEFFSAVARRDVLRALRRELEALCQARSPRSRWQWLEPPLHPAAVQRDALPARDSALLQTFEDPEARSAAARELESHRAAPAPQ